MAAELIGKAVCPLCKNGGARLSLSKKSLPVLTCTHADCGIQLFARGEEADFKLRALLQPADPPAAPVRTEPPTPAPVRTAPTPKQPAPEPVQAPAAPAAPAPAVRPAWGFGAYSSDHRQ